jgi:hypothetical protein
MPHDQASYYAERNKAFYIVFQFGGQLVLVKLIWFVHALADVILIMLWHLVCCLIVRYDAYG